MSAHSPTEPPWLLLFHQLPSQPSYLRVKIWRRLQRLGAVAVKNSVYVLPRSDGALEDLQWVRREIAESGGDASLCEARFVGGMSEDELEALFRAAREEDYRALAAEVRAIAGQTGKRLDAARRAALAAEVTRLERRLAEIVAIDFFGGGGREAVEGLLAELARRLGADGDRPTTRARREDYQGRTWVTRKGIHVDRIASAWLIRRFVDPAARFAFVAAKGYRPARGEVRFDMFQAEFTHEGDRCTFEVLVQRFAIDDGALAAIAEVVHDLDLKDGKFARPEAAGVGRALAGIATLPDDEARLAAGATLLDALHAAFARSPS